MSTEVLLYWITRLDAILKVAEVGACIMVVAAFVSGAFAFGSDVDDNTRKAARRIFKKVVLAWSLFIAVVVFVPTRRDALIIIGFGGTVEYLKSNETATQLPDKAIKALDKLVDEYLDKEPAGE